METTQTKSGMKQAVYFAIGVLLILGNAISWFTEPNFGFSSGFGGEAQGYNAGKIIMPILGAWLVYKAYKYAKS